MHDYGFLIIFFKNHFLLKIIFLLMRSIWLPGVHCILVLFTFHFGPPSFLSNRSCPAVSLLVCSSLSILETAHWFYSNF